MVTHCTNVYDSMKAESEIKEVEGSRMLVWEGFLTHLTSELDLPTPYYTRLRRDLIRMGCINQLRRGGGTTPSLWQVIKPPTLDLYLSTAHTRSERESNHHMAMQQ